ncbi:hypothetical protein VNDN101_09140 [Mycobacterium tuberculosis]|nr:hypothetical protein VNDN059_09140 [Mycobacterium tuberculosis]BCR56176.1 hypothetical protein VNDN068_09150 [Mycobacterium tuberculosis]BCR60212.1 hypothetical protein VNDN101_09140 [Mycobacterium tuberculosis]BCR72336.1 hypothetical protein VNDN181_09180 [Mycobacterium tuberculosis]
MQLLKPDLRRARPKAAVAGFDGGGNFQVGGELVGHAIRVVRGTEPRRLERNESLPAQARSVNKLTCKPWLVAGS